MEINLNHFDISSFAKKISRQDLLHLGLDEVAYVRRILADKTDDPDLYIVYAADGSQISIMHSYDSAIAAMHINNLVPMGLN